MRPRILHVISDLTVGGAELMLYRLLTRTLLPSAVISLKRFGPVGELIQRLGIPVEALGLRGGMPDPRGVLRLARRMRRFHPDLIQTWMYHADLIGGLAARVAPDIPVLWNLRQSNLDPRQTKRTTIWTTRLCAATSRWLPRRIVSCSEAAREAHVALGYDASRMLVIPNGFDLSAFRPDPAVRRAVREEFGLSEETPLIGLFGRFDPQKDHATFAEAAARLLWEHPNVHFVLCGREIEWENAELVALLRSAGITDRTLLLGCRSDMPRLTAALDLATSSSAYGEGFPNVIGEAMACGVPCVVTDVGESACLVEECGLVVQPRAPAALAGAWHKLLEMSAAERARLGAAGRQRILANFSLEAVVEQYESLYHEVWQESTATARPQRQAVTA